MTIEPTNLTTGIKNVTLLDEDFVKNLFNLYTVPGPTGTTEGLLDAWQKFLETYLVNPRDLYSGLNVEGGTGDSYQVKVSATDLEGYLGDKIKTEVSSGVTLTINGTDNKVINVALDIQESDSASIISFLKDSKTLKKPVAGVGMTINVTDDEITFNSTGDLGDITTQDITSQASESWNSEDEPLDNWQANAKVLIDGNATAIEGLATASMEYTYTSDLPLTTVEQKIPIVALLPSSNADIMSIDDVNHQASLLVDARYSYYTYLSVENSSQQNHIMHLITRTDGGVLLTDREFTIPKEGVELLLLELEVADITGTPLIFELFATADDINDLKLTYLKSHISAGGDALVSSYLKRDGSNAEEDFDIGDSNFSIDGKINPDGETTEFGGGITASEGVFTRMSGDPASLVADTELATTLSTIVLKVAGVDKAAVYYDPTDDKVKILHATSSKFMQFDADGNLEVDGGVSTDGGANYLKHAILRGTWVTGSDLVVAHGLDSTKIIGWTLYVNGTMYAESMGYSYIDGLNMRIGNDGGVGQGACIWDISYTT